MTDETFRLITLKRKASRDDESSDMLDFIFSHGIFDISQAYRSIGIKTFIEDECMNDSYTFVSSEAARRDEFEQKLQEFTGLLTKMFDKNC